MKTFRERLVSEVIVFDGGVGTSLYEKGIYINTCFDELNLTNPNLVMDVHRDYVDAGADVIETNTFGANRFKLAPHGQGRSRRRLRLSRPPAPSGPRRAARRTDNASCHQVVQVPPAS